MWLRFVFCFNALFLILKYLLFKKYFASVCLCHAAWHWRAHVVLFFHWPSCCLREIAEIETCLLPHSLFQHSSSDVCVQQKVIINYCIFFLTIKRLSNVFLFFLPGPVWRPLVPPVSRIKHDFSRDDINVASHTSRLYSQLERTSLERVNYLGHQALKVSRARDAVPPWKTITRSDTLQQPLAFTVQLLHWSLQHLHTMRRRECINLL